MASKTELTNVYMQTALLHASLSKAKRKQVGAVIVTSSGIIIPGYNGTPAGMQNDCEDRVFSAITQQWSLVTKPEVIHAELNCILKAAKEGISLHQATVYVTLSPCIQCASMLKQLGISRLVYLEKYRDLSGIDYLESGQIQVEYLGE